MRALSFSIPDIGYTQGMNYLAANLLNNADELDTYYIMLSLLKFYNYKEFFTNELKGLKLATEILDQLTRIYFPDLFDFL